MKCTVKVKHKYTFERELILVETEQITIEAATVKDACDAYWNTHTEAKVVKREAIGIPNVTKLIAADGTILNRNMVWSALAGAEREFYSYLAFLDQEDVRLGRAKGLHEQPETPQGK
jgi:hypothetical protein